MGLWSKHPGWQPEGLSKKGSRIKLTLIPIFIIMLVALFVTGGLVTEYPGFCGSCHEMNPEYQTWKATAHQNVKCVDCHREPGLSNVIVSKISTARELYLHFAGFERPITLHKVFTDEVCTRCHSSNRLYTPAGDIIIPHERHKAAKVACVSCHSGVAHGKIAQREVTRTGDLAAWTLATGEKETPENYTKPAMSSCMECHYRKKVTTHCQDCHRTITLPDNHKDSEWLGAGQHGLAARESLSYCHKCHSYSIEVMKVSTKDKTAEYARMNSFCSACHLIRPPSHRDHWLMDHKNQVAAKGRENCLVCHNEDRSKEKERTSAVYCNQCHGQDTHPSDWRRRHPQVVKTEGISEKRCFDCHDSAQCSSCHTNPAVKPF